MTKFDGNDLMQRSGARATATAEPASRSGATSLSTLWREEPALMATGIFLLMLAVPSALGIWLDPRTITGAPAWLKPTKFALSTGLYAITLAWMFTWLPAWTRTRRLVSLTTVVVMLLELAIIDLQAWRGTTSHFNISTPLDAALFSLMGLAIFTQTATTVAIAVAFWRERFSDAAMGWALRLGMTLTIAGALTGGLMTSPTNAQLQQVQATRQMPIVGAHTVGGADGGPGLPGVGWSTQHGDLRVPHFVGLHAMQGLPLFALFVRRRLEDDSRRSRVVVAAGAAYALTFALLLVQALRGVPLSALFS